MESSQLDGVVATGSKQQCGRRLVLFDLDRTLIPGSSVIDLARAWSAEGGVSSGQLIAVVVGGAVFARRGERAAITERLRDAVLTQVAGRSVDELRTLITGVGERVAARVYAEGRSLIECHRAAGDRCVVLSASPEELVIVVARVLGADLALGSRGEIVDGRYTGRLDGPLCHGAGKLARLRLALGPIDLSTATAYGDSTSDLPLLEACGHPVAVNADRRLRRVAAQRGWPTVRFG